MLRIQIDITYLVPGHEIETNQEFSRPWPVFRTHHGSRIVCMSHTLNVTLKPMARESKKHMVPASSDESRSISLAWGMEYNSLKPGTTCESRGLGSQLWHD